MKIPIKKYLFPALVIAVALTSWQGFCTGYASIFKSAPGNDYSTAAASGLTEEEKTGDPAVISDIPSGISISNVPLETRGIASLNTRWTLDQIKAVSTTNQRYDNDPILIAVLDTGIDQYHKDLYGKVVAEINLSQSGTAGDIYGHGTAIGGIITAKAEDNGISGVAPGSRLLNVKVADDRGQCRSSALAEGIIRAVDHGAEVINISLEIKEDTRELKEAVDYAWNKGAVIIAAAGNDGSSSPVYPASYDNCLAVTAIKDNRTLVPMANYGNWVDLGAPGYKIYSLLPGDKYGYKYGTSFAAAYISGLAGILFSLVDDTNNDGKLNDEVRQVLETGYRWFGLSADNAAYTLNSSEETTSN